MTKATQNELIDSLKRFYEAADSVSYDDEHDAAVNLADWALIALQEAGVDLEQVGLA